MINERKLLDNYRIWERTIPRSLAQALKMHHESLVSLANIIVAGDYAISKLCIALNLCPDCRGGLGGCFECCFTGCADDYRGLSPEALRIKWLTHYINPEDAQQVSESLRLSNPDDFHD